MSNKHEYNRFSGSEKYHDDDSGFTRQMKKRLDALEHRVRYVTTKKTKTIPYVTREERQDSNAGNDNRYWCAECGGRGNGALIPCDGCNEAFYCNPKCKGIHWEKGHDEECKSHHRMYPAELEARLNTATFAELADLLDLTPCGPWVIEKVWSLIRIDMEINGDLIRRAESYEVAYMAKNIARQLDVHKDDKVAFWQLISIADVLVTTTASTGLQAIQATSLLSVLGKHFFNCAPGFADSNQYNGITSNKNTVSQVKKFVVLMTNLISGATSIPGDTVFLQECADLTVAALMDCVLSVQSEPDLKNSQFEHSSREAMVALATRKAYILEVEKQDLRQDLRRYLRKLTYRGFAPSNMHHVQLTFSMDMQHCQKEKASEAIQAWATITSNLSTRCGVDVTELKFAVRSLAASSFGVKLCFVDDGATFTNSVGAQIWTGLEKSTRSLMESFIGYVNG